MGFSGAFAVSFREGICLKKNPVNRHSRHVRITPHGVNSNGWKDGNSFPILLMAEILHHQGS